MHSFAALACLAVPIAVNAVSRDAFADPTDSQLQAARELFGKAEQDEDAGRWADALEKLRLVSTVRFTAGVRYHMALCEEHLDRLASALDDFEAARTQAQDTNANDVLPLVTPEVTQIENRVPRLVLDTPAENPGTTVTIDGASLAAARFA